MEPDHTHEQEHKISHDLEEAFGMDLDHRQMHYEHFARGHKNYADSDETETEDEQFDHHDLRYIDHHDDYYRGDHGDLYVDHHDRYGEDHRDDRRRRTTPYHGHSHGDVDEDYDHHYFAPSHHEDPRYYHHPKEHYYSDEDSELTDSEATDSEAELEEYLRHVKESQDRRERKTLRRDPHYPGHHPEDKQQTQPAKPAPAPAPTEAELKAKQKEAKKLEKLKRKQLLEQPEQD